jgi:predicted nucleic acid-binding protein
MSFASSYTPSCSVEGRRYSRMSQNGTGGPQDALWDLIESAPVDLLPLGASDSARMRELMRKYRDLPMDLADAALVTVAERERISRIFTLDQRDFEIYRPARLGRFSLLP